MLERSNKPVDKSLIERAELKETMRRHVTQPKEKFEGNIQD
jgi:hypothetical protein